MIFYFSGTGNSLYAASKFANCQNDKILDIADCIKSKKFEFEILETENLGFVVPIYFWNIPSIVLDFVQCLKIKNYSNQFVYICFTCGGSIGNADKKISKILASNGINLSATYSVIMPDNYILEANLITKEKDIEPCLKSAEKTINAISKEIIDHKSNNQFIERGLVPFLSTKLMYHAYEKLRETKSFYTTNKCVSCGLCENICPCDVIKIKDGKPTWIKDKCTQCLACIHHCPTAAIQHKKRTENRGRYVNPNVKNIQK